MRKAQKKQAEDFVELLGQSHDEIRKAVKQNNISTALSLLADCQEGAISLGNLVEKTEGEDAPLISLLEEYCERLYRIYEKLSGENQTEENKIGTNQVGANQAGGISVNADKIQKQLRQLFIRMKNGIRDIKVRREAVFLPYKASMWDSLESVWKTAEEDPDCDAYVIPIPYYDRKPGGSFGELHYEGSQYPEYVPVTWYEDYDFESRKPDMIFIHNPYDDCNLVTSVLPFFYSSNLKQFTEQLIYIPYFVLEEIDPDNGPAVENMKHFCLSPGVYNADKVIVQSENMRQVYIKVMTEATGKETRAYWEQKILGLGSPKFDKVLSTRKEDLKIPEDWLRIIRKPDGSWKKIIFYNTSVGALLQHSEQYLEKMRDVFRVFYENRDEVALLWRPHPLIKATIESMRPQLWAGYREIVKRYREEGWGIYDDSADMDRAVALSDGYYGDVSSVAWLYQNTEKPVMLQNVYSLPENNCSLAMDNIVEFEGKWWFFAFKDSGIYRMDKETFEARLVTRIPWFDNKGIGSPEYGRIHIFNKKIFILPWVADNIAIYDIQNKQIRHIKFERGYYRGMVFWDAVELGNVLYLIPCAYAYCLKIDMVTEKAYPIEVTIDKNIPEDKRNFAWGSIFVEEPKVYFGQIDGKKIIEMDLEKGEQQVHECSHIEGGVAGICGDEGNIWIVPRKTEKILWWIRETKELRILSAFPDGYRSGEWSFSKVYLGRTHLYLLPRDANMCIVVDRNGGEIASLSLDNAPLDATHFCDRYMRYANVWEEQGEIYIINAKQGNIHCLQEKTMEGYADRRIRLLQERGDIVEHPIIAERENLFENVRMYLELIKKNRDMAENASESKKYGYLIWQVLLQES